MWSLSARLEDGQGPSNQLLERAVLIRHTGDNFQGSTPNLSKELCHFLHDMPAKLSDAVVVRLKPFGEPRHCLVAL
jgi:hypothetical protein